MFSKNQILRALNSKVSETSDTSIRQYFIVKEKNKEHYASRDKSKKFWEGLTCNCAWCGTWGGLEKQKWCYVKLAIAIWLWKNKKIPAEVWEIITKEMGENIKLLGE